LYTADLLKAPSAPGASTDAYADDLTVCGEGSTLAAAEASAQAEVDRITTWAIQWRQKFNASKSEAMAFVCTPHTISISVNGGPVPQARVIRVLGVHFDPRLTWKDHIDRVINKCAKNLSFFRHLAWTPGLSLRWRRTAYLALVRSTITYGNVAFCNASKRQLRRLSVVQNNCLRAICNVRLADRVRVVNLQRRCRIDSLADFFAKTQQRYIERAVQHVLPIREDIEQFRLRPHPPLRSPIAVLNSRLPPGPLPPMS
jgi:hypothetical protein